MILKTTKSAFSASRKSWLSINYCLSRKKGCLRCPWVVMHRRSRRSGRSSACRTNNWTSYSKTIQIQAWISQNLTDLSWWQVSSSSFDYLFAHTHDRMQYLRTRPQHDVTWCNTWNFRNAFSTTMICLTIVKTTATPVLWYGATQCFNSLGIHSRSSK